MDRDIRNVAKTFISLFSVNIHYEINIASLFKVVNFMGCYIRKLRIKMRPKVRNGLKATNKDNSYADVRLL